MREPAGIAPDPADVAAAAATLCQARSVLFVTGAGVSADSGLPTYRGAGGLYTGDGLERGMPVERILSAETLEERPELTWDVLAALERSGRGTRPNRAHEVIALLQDRIPRCVVLTQNVDGLHGDAGSRDVIEIHGTTRALRCTRCPRRERVADWSRLSFPPRCPDCGAVVRPDVVLFGETLPEEAVGRLHGELARGFDAVFVVGTTAVFPYIVLPVQLAPLWGAPSVEVNPEESEVSALVDVRVRAGAAAALDAIWRELAGEPPAP